MAQRVITFHYTLTDKGGQVLDSSKGQNPLIFLSGVGQIIPGLEAILIGLNKGDSRTITVPAKEAYGIYDAKLVYKVERSRLPAGEIKLGDVFEVGDGDKLFPVSIVDITGDQVSLDGNHPLAGRDLTFAVDIVDARAATTEEIAHGHTHGADGHHHH